MSSCMTAGDNNANNMITGDEGLEQLSQEAGSAQPLQPETIAGAMNTLTEASVDTSAGDRGVGGAGMGVEPQDLQRSRQRGSDAGTGAAAREAGSAAVAAVASGPSAGSAKQGAVAALVQGGPEEDLGRVRAGQGSVTEALTPERNAALLKVRFQSRAHAPQLHWGPTTTPRLQVAVQAAFAMTTSTSSTRGTLVFDDHVELYELLSRCCRARQSAGPSSKRRFWPGRGVSMRVARSCMAVLSAKEPAFGRAGLIRPPCSFQPTSAHHSRQQGCVNPDLAYPVARTPHCWQTLLCCCPPPASRW